MFFHQSNCFLLIHYWPTTKSSVFKWEKMILHKRYPDSFFCGNNYPRVAVCQDILDISCGYTENPDRNGVLRRGVVGVCQKWKAPQDYYSTKERMLRFHYYTNLIYWQINGSSGKCVLGLMNSQYPQLEKFQITVPVSHSVEDFDFVGCAFHFARWNPISYQFKMPE